MENQTTLVNYDAIVTELEKSIHLEDSEAVKRVGHYPRATILKDFRTIGFRAGRQSGMWKYINEKVVDDVQSILFVPNMEIAKYMISHGGEYLEESNPPHSLNRFRTYSDRRVKLFSAFQNKKRRENNPIDWPLDHISASCRALAPGGLKRIYVDNSSGTFSTIAEKFYAWLAEITPENPTIVIVG